MAELLSPAGNLDKLRVALHYGADAVYVGAEQFSLRARADNFSFEELGEAVRIAHDAGKKLYLAVNSFFRESMLRELPPFLKKVRAAAPDALIVSDPGLIWILRREWPELPVHVSTQANTMNSAACRMYKELGVSRVILARELSLADIRALRRELPDMELEVFVHGAMCMAYSGRCLISNYMTHSAFLPDGDRTGTPARIANHGDCSHTCRWEYRLTEKMRGEAVYTVEEGDTWSQIFASKDLCMVRHLDQLLEAGVDSFKIEGRMKSVLYTAVTADVYSHALEAFAGNSPGVSDDDTTAWEAELQMLTRREHSTGFFFPEDRIALQPSGRPGSGGYLYIARVMEKCEEDLYRCLSSNRIDAEDLLECIGPSMKRIKPVPFTLLDNDKKTVPYLGHGHYFYLRTDTALEPGDILRKERNP